MNLLQVADVNPNDASGWGQAAILVTTVAGFLFQAYREHRNHKWETQRLQEELKAAALSREQVATRVEQESAAVRLQVEQRAVELAARVAQEASDVRTRVEQEAANVRNQVELRAGQMALQARAELHNVQRAIEDNTIATKRVEAANTQALNAANSFNTKLHSALAQLDDVRTDATTAAANRAALVETTREAVSTASDGRAEHIEEVVEDNNDQIRQTREDLESLGKT